MLQPYISILWVVFMIDMFVSSKVMIIGSQLVFSNNLLMCWGKLSKAVKDVQYTISLPLAYKSFYSVVLGTINAHGSFVVATFEDGDNNGHKTLSSFVLAYTYINVGWASGAYWFTIGS